MGLEVWAGGCRAGTWSWTGPGKTEQSHAQAKVGTEGPLRGTPVLLLEAAVCPWGTEIMSLVNPYGGHKSGTVFLVLVLISGPNSVQYSGWQKTVT